VLVAAAFSLFGFILGIWADGFERLQIVPMLILTPLTFLGGTSMRRGEIRTPAFMPVGTAATVKAMKPEACARGRRHHPRQHLSPDAAPRRGAGGAAGRPARFMNWTARSSPTAAAIR
jgi:hypothetical protein